jgi:hypothetical protein
MTLPSVSPRRIRRRCYNPRFDLYPEPEADMGGFQHKSKALRTASKRLRKARKHKQRMVKKYKK